MDGTQARRYTARHLEGVELEDGWRVIQPFDPPADTTGGEFSAGYQVQNRDGRRGFMKAMDIGRALRPSVDVPLILQHLTTAFNFEVALLRACQAKNLDRVALPIGTGLAVVPDTHPGVAPYLIFDLADGDIYAHEAVAQGFDLAWMLRSLHYTATGLWQLHKLGIAHQDVKPSNLLVYDGREVKLTDLGRAAHPAHTPPHHERDVAGDATYAPPELLYRQVSPDWNQRRFACDAYLLGSMVVFFFLGQGLTSLIQAELPAAQRILVWPGPYEAVLPHVRDAFDRVMEELEEEVPEAIRQDLVAATRQLADPDPAVRGHPRTRAQAGTRGNPYSLERFVSLFDILARKAELDLLRIGGR